ncbi:MAG: CHC2 zinc finger domain-containing protein [bacterium]
MSSAAQTIKERLTIAEVIGAYIKIEKTGANYKARCPFHNEKTPSFFISPARNNYYCFGCGVKGDIFTFVEEFERIDFLGALKILADKAGVELMQFQHDRSKESDLDKLRNILETSTVFYENQLHGNPKSKFALDYLYERGLTDETIKAWRIGLALNEWRNLEDHLKTNNISAVESEKVGLIKQTGTSVYDRFRERIMFPLADSSGRVVGYSGRFIEFAKPEIAQSTNAVNDDSNTVAKDAVKEAPKYLNSPDGPLFNKSEILYGYHKAKEGIRKFGYAILVEGQFDMLLAHQAGFNNTVATSGTSLTKLHLEKIKRLTDNTMIVYDADKAGLKASLKAWDLALSLGMDVKIAGLPKGEDPASLILKDKEKFKTCLKNAKHIIDFYLDILEGEGLKGRDLWKAVEIEVLPYVLAIESSIDRAHFINRISLRTDIQEADLRAEVERLIARNKLQNNPTSRSDGNVSDNVGDGGIKGNGDRENLEANSMDHSSIKGFDDLSDSDKKTLDRLIGLILWLRDSANLDKAEQVLSRAESFLDSVSKKYFDERISSSPTGLSFEAEVLFAGSSKLDHDIEELLLEIEERTAKQTLSILMNNLNKMERLQKKDEAMKILKECQEISLKLAEVQKKKKLYG